MSDKERVFIRLYDNCIEDDRKPPYPREYIFRKHRIRTGISLSIIHISLFLLLIYLEDNFLVLSIIFISLCGWLSVTRIGVVS